MKIFFHGRNGGWNGLNIVEIILYALLFVIFYLVIGKAFDKVNELLEKRFNSKIYDVGLIVVLF